MIQTFDLVTFDSYWFICSLVDTIPVLEQKIECTLDCIEAMYLPCNLVKTSSLLGCSTTDSLTFQSLHFLKEPYVLRKVKNSA